MGECRALSGFRVFRVWGLGFGFRFSAGFWVSWFRVWSLGVPGYLVP